jgi:hypothetical protein
MKYTCILVLYWYLYSGNIRVQYGTVILWRTQNYSVAHPILWRMVSGVRHRIVILWRTRLGAPQNSHYSVAHLVVRHRIAYLVATILWRTTHAPQNSKMVRHRIAFLY